MGYILGIAYLIIYVTGVAESICSGGEEVKIKFDQVPDFMLYEERCDSAFAEENALLGSQTRMNCGQNGSAIVTGIEEIFIIDLEAQYSNYVEKLCMNVRGVANVTIEMEGDAGTNSHTEVPPDSNWYPFCITPGNAFDVYEWMIHLEPKFDGSSVAVKNMKLALCRFLLN